MRESDARLDFNFMTKSSHGNPPSSPSLTSVRSGRRISRRRRLRRHPLVLARDASRARPRTSAVGDERRARVTAPAAKKPAHERPPSRLFSALGVPSRREERPYARPGRRAELEKRLTQAREREHARTLRYAVRKQPRGCGPGDTRQRPQRPAGRGAGPGPVRRSVASALSAATCDHASAVSGRRSRTSPSANLVAVKHAQNVDVSAAAVDTESPSRARATVNIHDPNVTSPATFNAM